MVYSREDEIRDARDKRCTGHGWTSVRRKIYIYTNIQSAVSFGWVSHLHSKGERPTARGWRAALRRKGLRILRDGVEDEE